MFNDGPFNDGPFCERVFVRTDYYRGMVHGCHSKKIELSDSWRAKFDRYIEKHEGKLTQQSLRPLQGNGMDAISKSPVFSSRCY